MALLLNSLLVLRVGWVAGQSSLIDLSFALLIASGALHVQGLLRRRELRRGDPTDPRPQLMQATSGIALLATGVSLWSVLVS